MKRLALPLFLLGLTAVTGASAFADFVAGRVRPLFRSSMTTVQSFGTYREVSRADVLLNFEDGKNVPVSLTVSMPEFKTSTTLPLREIRKSDCGDHYVAEESQGPVQHSIELVDYSHASCEIVVEKLWNVSVKDIQGERVLSELDLAGNPETIFVTL